MRCRPANAVLVVGASEAVAHGAAHAELGALCPRALSLPVLTEDTFLATVSFVIQVNTKQVSRQCFQRGSIPTIVLPDA